MSRISVLFLIAAAGCAAPADPSFMSATIQVTIATSGMDLDPDGYTLAINGVEERSVNANDTAVVTGVARGRFELVLTGLATNCSTIGPNPIVLQIESGGQLNTEFMVVCEVATGAIEVSVSVDNNLDPNGFFLTHNQEVIGTVDAEEEVVRFSSVPAGRGDLGLADISVNCHVIGDNPQQIDLTAGSVVFVSFAVACVPPPGGRILFSAHLESNWDIFVMNPDGSGVDRLVDGIADEVHPSWSPDGAQIAYELRQDSASTIWVMNVDGSSPRQITAATSFDQAPAWSPHGNRIAFQSNRNGSWDIWSMNPDGSNAVNLTNTSGQDERDPAWSPDGSTISYAAVDPATSYSDIWTIQANGTSALNLTQTPGQRVRYPTWAPDGSRLAFTKQNPDTVGVWRVHIMDTDGGDLHVVGEDIPSFLVADVPWFLDPIWSLDGDAIVSVENELQILKFPADGSGGFERIFGDGTQLIRDPAWGP